MLNQLLPAEWHVSVQPHDWARVKRSLLVLLAIWMSYFLLVNTFVHSLNKIAVLGIPLGTCLAVQGAAIVFGLTLLRIARHQS